MEVSAYSPGRDAQRPGRGLGVEVQQIAQDHYLALAGWQLSDGADQIDPPKLVGDPSLWA